MGRLILDISMSLDGFVAGPDQTLDAPLGRGGERLHESAFAAPSWRRQHGLEGGERNVDSDLADERISGVGATIMGRHMFSGGTGPWEDDPNARGWWGDDPPFHHPVFVLTSTRASRSRCRAARRSRSSRTASRRRSTRPAPPPAIGTVHLRYRPAA